MKRMKLAAVVLAASVLAAGTTITAWADLTTPGSESVDVTGTYRSGSTSNPVYSVDVSWGSMAFTYTEGSEGTWNPVSHQYDGATEAGWTADGNEGGKVTVTNHSNAAIKANLSFSSETGYAEIGGTFTETSGTANDGSLELASAENTAVADAPKAQAVLALTGKLAENTPEGTKIGTVTVSFQ